LVEQALSLMTQRGHRVHPAPTTGPDTAADIARECIARGADLIVAAGGDGTINEVANGVVGSAIPMMVLPGGTANVLAMEIGVGGKVKKAVKRMHLLEPRRIPCGRLTTASGEQRYFLLMAGAGLDAHIVHTLSPWLKARLGKLAYWVGGFGSVMRVLPQFDVRVNGHHWRSSFTLASRVRNYGGDLEIARSIRIDEPAFELIIFEGRLAFAYLRYFYGVVANQLERMKGVTVTKATAIEFQNPDGEALVQIDGEPLGPLPVRVELVPDALTLMIPSTYGRD
jgi:diacylglycerol kinase (ATP)